tara:strand:+ start:261 stop:905 length:645 start_codon:yes stop_codon:yes gene_type:complete
MISTHRRKYVDSFLNSQVDFMHGNIVDIGGKKNNKRGSFHPPIDNVDSWNYVNTDKSTNPDYCCSADSIPISDNSIDGFLLCEVLEHLENPEDVLNEAYRILKEGGIGWITSPFLFQIHADPSDYQRWTNIKLKKELLKIGYKDINIFPMGGVIAVIHDLYYCALMRSPNKGRFLNNLGINIYKYTFNIMSKLDKYMSYTNTWMTTGWAITLKK